MPEKQSVVFVRTFELMATGWEGHEEQCLELVCSLDHRRETRQTTDEEKSESMKEKTSNTREGSFAFNVVSQVMQIGRQSEISFGSGDERISHGTGSEKGGPVLREHWRPTGRLRVGRSRVGFPDCKCDHLVQVLVCKNGQTRETLDITDKYDIAVRVTYDGKRGTTALDMPDYQCKRIKSETKGIMAGVVGFLFRFHEPSTKYKIEFALRTVPQKKNKTEDTSKEDRGCETLSELLITLETGPRALKKSGRGRKEMEERKITLSLKLGPASFSKESKELCKRSIWVVNQLQSRRNDAKWDDFNKFSCDLLLKFADADTQITIKLEQSVAALYRNDFDRSVEFLDEAFGLMPKAINVQLLAGRGYGYRAGIARRRRNFGEAHAFMELAEQNSLACHTNLDTSYIAYEKASVLLDFIVFSPQRSLKQVSEALHSLEKCIDVCLRLEIEDNAIHHFAFVKIALLLLDCRTDVGRERVLNMELLAYSEACLNKLKKRYWSDITEGLQVQFYLASSDLEYRKGNYTEAMRFANLGKEKAEEFGFNTEISLAQERLNYLRVLVPREATGSGRQPSSASPVSASEGEHGDVSSSGAESDWLQSLE